MNKKKIAYIIYIIGGIWALYECSKDPGYYVFKNITAFAIASVFGIVGTIILCSNKNKDNNEQKEVEEKTAAEKLLDYKKLLDANVITQEEFEKKKKEILGEEAKV